MNTTVEVLGFAADLGWQLWAVQYFFLIGISCAAFFLSLPGMVWRLPQWRGASRRALLVALVCGLTAPVALLADLHQPGRFLNFYLHSNFGSWMAWGAYFIPLYLLGLLLYAWLSLRPLLATLAEHSKRPAGFYRTLAYGGHDNAGAIRAAAIVAALGAMLVLLYTGMETMVVRARPLWHTPLLPVLLAVTAFAGGLGMTGLFEALAGKTRSAPLLNRWLELGQWASLATLTGWTVWALGSSAEAANGTIGAMRGSSGWLLTIAALFATTMLALWLSRTRRTALIAPALLALLGAWLVRWIIVLGGQSMPKIGATSHAYFLSITADNLLGIMGTAGLCLALYLALTSLVPWDDQAEA